MADREININAKIANLQKIKEELSKVTVNFKVESKQVDELIKLSKSGLNIKVHLDFGQQLKELLDLQKKGISIKAGITGAQQLRSTTQKEVYGPPTGGARSARDVALTRANEIAAKEEAAFRQRVNIQHQKNVLNEQALQRAEQARALEREQNDRKLRTLQEAQLQRAKKAQQEEDAFRKRMAKADRSIFSSGRTFYGGSEGSFYTDSQFAEETKHRSIQQAAIAEQRKAERAYNNRLLKDLQLAKIQRYKQAASLDGSFTEFVNGVPVGSRSKINPSQVLKQQRAAQQAAANSGLAIGPNGVIYGYSSAQGKSFAQGQYKAGAKQQQSQQAASQAFQNQFNQALASNFAQANSPLFGGFGGPAPAPFSAINPVQQIRVKALAEAQRKLDAAYARRLEKAQDFVTNSPLKAFLGVFTGDSVHEEAAKKYNVKRRDITSRPSYFDPKRIFKDGNFQDILYTGLLGGPAQGIGAALGAATFDKGGSLIGANIAAATVAVFQKISDAMTSAVKAGAEYERAVTGITGIFQATTDVVDADGNPVGIRRALAFQGKRAEGIQRASQRALLPLGITGATASALTQSLAAGLAQRGIAPDEKSTETLLRRFGAAIQTLQPELASDPNLIRRGFEDIIGGGPQASRTELGSALRGIAPGLFTGGKKSIEDILRATEALDALVDAIRNSDKASIEYQKTLGNLQLAQQELGKGILEGLAPGLKAFNEELQKNSASSSFKDLGKAIGESATAIVKGLIPALTNLNGTVAILAKIATGDFEGLGDLVGKYLTRNRLDNASGDEGIVRLNQKFRDQGKPTVRRGLDGRLVVENVPSASDIDDINQTLLDADNKKRFEKGLPIREYKNGRLVESSAEKQQLFAQENINTILNKAKSSFVIENPRTFAEDQLKDSPAVKLAGIELLREKLRSRSRGRNVADIDLENIGLNAQQIQTIGALQQEREGLFDSSEQGQLGRAKSERESIAKQLELAEANLRIRQKILKRESSTDLEGPEGIKILNIRKLDEEAIAKARAGAVKAEEEVLKLRQQGVDKEKEIAQKRLSILQKGIDVQDTGTFEGRRAALNARDKLTAQERQDIDKQILNAQAILNNPKASEAEKQQALARIEEAKLNKIGNISKAAQNARDREQLGLSEVSFALGGPLRRGSAADAATKNTLDQKVLGLEAKGLPLELERLAQATRDATKALDAFASDKELRRLGVEGEAIAADEAIVAAGGTPIGDPTLVKGSPFFDPRKRAEFERQIAEERARVVGRKKDRFEEEDAEQTKRLENEKAQAKLNEERARTVRPEEIKLQKRALERQAVQNAIDAAKEALDAKQQDPKNPELIKEYEEARKKVDDLLKEQIEGGGSSSTRPALAIPQGPATSVPVFRTPLGAGNSGTTNYGYPVSTPTLDTNGRAFGIGQKGPSFFNINGLTSEVNNEIEKAIQDTMNLGFGHVFGINKAPAGQSGPSSTDFMQELGSIHATLIGIQNNLKGGTTTASANFNSTIITAIQQIQQTLDACSCDDGFDCCGDLVALLIEIQSIILEFSASFREIFSFSSEEGLSSASDTLDTSIPDFEEVVSGKLLSPDKKTAVEELLATPESLREVFGPRNEIEETSNGLRFTGKYGLLPNVTGQEPPKDDREFANVVIPEGQEYAIPLTEGRLTGEGLLQSLNLDTSKLIASAFDADTKRFNPYKLDYTNTESTLQRINSEFGSGKNIKYPTDEINESVGKLRKLFNKEEKGHTEAGNSIFDDLTALKPLTQEQMTVAFSNALQQNFV